MKPPMAWYSFLEKIFSIFENSLPKMWFTIIIIIGNSDFISPYRRELFR